MSDPIVVEHFTDPLSVRCWASQPAIRRFRYDFPEVRWVPRTTVLFPDTTDPDCLPGGVEDRAEMDRYWRDRAADSGMPVEGDLWASDPPDSSRIPCEAVALLRERDPGTGLALCRRLHELAFAGGAVPTDPAGLARVAAEATGADRGAVEAALAEGRGAELVEADLERGRELAEHRLADDPDGVETIPMLPRTRRDPADIEWDPAPDGESDEEGDGDEEGSAESDDDSGEDGSRDAETGDPGDEDGDPRPSDPRVLAPPTVWVHPAGAEGPDEGVATTAAAGYDALASAVRRFDRQAGDTATDPMRQATDAMSGYVAQAEVVEQVTSEDYAPQVRDYLDRFGVSFVAEIAAGVDCTTGTCRRVLADLHEQGVAEYLGANAWRLDR